MSFKVKKCGIFFSIIPFNDFRISIFCNLCFLTYTIFFQDLFLLKIFKKVYSRMVQGKKWETMLISTSSLKFKTHFYKVHWAQNTLEIWTFDQLSTIFLVHLMCFYLIMVLFLANHIMLPFLKICINCCVLHVTIPFTNDVHCNACCLKSKVHKSSFFGDSITI